MDFHRLESPKRFEELCEQLLLLQYPGIIKTVDGRGGDKGTDSFIGTIDNQVSVFQFKFFQELNPGHWSKISSSLETSYIATHPRNWCLMVSARFTNHDWEKWEQLKRQYHDMKLEVQTASDLEGIILKYQQTLVPAFPELFPIFETASALLELYRSKSNSAKIPAARKPAKFRGERPIWIGRRSYIEKIGHLFKDSPAPVSIIGEGGMGKTALAFRTMHVFSEYFDLIIPVYFNSNMKYRDLLTIIAKAMGAKSEDIAKTEDNELRQSIIDLLAQHTRPLIFLDSYELVSQDGPLGDDSDDAQSINGFLENVPPNVRILLTSQSRYNLDGENQIDLEGLSSEEGKDLFVELAKRQFRRGQSEEMQEFLGKLCIDLGGHPLSIELLARSYRGGGITELQSMKRLLGLGITNPRSEEPRFISLQQCFNYSLKRLTMRQREALFKLSMLHSPFSLEMLSLIFKPEVSNYVETLYEACLLRRIESDDDGEFDRLHRMYYFHSAVRSYIDSKAQNSEKEQELLSIYLVVCYSKMILFDILGHNNADAERCLNVILGTNTCDFERAARKFGSPKKSRNLFDAISEILFGQRKFDQALEYQILSYNMNQEAGHVDTRLARDTGQIARILLEQYKYEDAIDKFKESLALHLSLKDAHDAAVDYINLAEASRRLGRIDDALGYLHRALEIDTAGNDKAAIAQDQDLIGVMYRFKQNFNAAIKQHEIALELYKEIEDVAGAMSALGNKGIALQLNDKLDEARPILEEVLAYHERVGIPEKIAVGHSNLGNICMKEGRLNDALDHYKKALEIFSKYNARSETGMVYRGIAHVFLLAGMTEKATAFINEALRIHRDIQDKVMLAADEEVKDHIESAAKKNPENQ